MVAKLKKHPRLTVAASAALVVIICFTVWLTVYQPRSSAQAPQYQTISPSGKPVEDLGGWKRVSPPDQEPVFAYSDNIDGVPISVSQQPLPESFRSDTKAQIAELAKRFNATTEILTDSATLYVGTSAKGPQSAILSKNGLLIMIKSQRKISNQSWASYVQSLS